MPLSPRRLTLPDVFALGLAGGAIVGALVAAQIPKSAIASTPLCWSVVFLGRECPGCGLTRSFAAIGRGALGEANALNPLGPVLFAWAIAVVAIRAGKMLAPRFRYWVEIDIAFAGAAILSLVVRTITFYFG